jgi:hypothetical protein
VRTNELAWSNSKPAFLPEGESSPVKPDALTGNGQSARSTLPDSAITRQRYRAPAPLNVAANLTPGEIRRAHTTTRARQAITRSKTAAHMVAVIRVFNEAGNAIETHNTLAFSTNHQRQWRRSQSSI